MNAASMVSQICVLDHFYSFIAYQGLSDCLFLKFSSSAVGLLADNEQGLAFYWWC